MKPAVSRAIAVAALVVACSGASAGIPVVGVPLDPAQVRSLVEQFEAMPEYQQAAQQARADAYNRAKAEAIREAQQSKTKARPVAAAAIPASGTRLRPMQQPPTATQGEK
jgi:hypothetical protein